MSFLFAFFFIFFTLMTHSLSQSQETQEECCLESVSTNFEETSCEFCEQEMSSISEAISCESCEQEINSGIQEVMTGELISGNCPPSSYSTVIPQSIRDCIPCKTGSVAYYAGSSSCILCRAGARAVDKKTCETCPAGTYSDRAGSLECTPCPHGSVATYDNVGYSECIVCRAGTRAVDKKSCTPCPAGTYSDQAGSLECKPCPSGSVATYDNIGYTECNVCRAGTREVDRKNCVLCPAGTYSNQTGSQECTPCPGGSVATYDNIGYSSCIVCRAGTREIDRKSCALCPGGTYSDKAGSLECKPCPSGSIAPYDNVGYAACIACQPGWYSVDAKRCVPSII